MANIIIAEPDKLEAGNGERQEEAVIFSELKDVTYGEDNIYVSSSLLEVVQEKQNIYVYFELENYPFFQKAKALLAQHDKPKGVFRYHRVTKTDKDESLLVEDIGAIISLFGDPEHVFIKRTDKQLRPYHVIVTLNFGGGTMAHVEYTLSDKEHVELEWSGIEQILEFNSSEMDPFTFGNKELIPLTLRMKAASILNGSYLVDQKFITYLDKCRSLLKDGVNN